MTNSNETQHIDNRTFAEYLSMSEPTEILTLEILETLENSPTLKDKNIETVAGLTQGEIASLIALEFPEKKRSANKIATELIKLFQRDEIRKSDRPLEANGNMTIPEVVVKFPESPESMSLKAIMLAIIEDPSCGSEYLLWIEKKENVKSALNKSSRPLVLVNGKLDIEASIDRINHLAQSHTREQRPDRGKGEKFVSLKQGLGLYQPVYIHPLDGQPISGKDEAGYDYSRLNRDLAKSLIWARNTVHPLLPQDLNKATVGAILFSDKLETPFNLILQDYWNAVDAKNPAALNVQFEVDEAEAKKKADPKLVELLEEVTEAINSIPEDDRDRWKTIVKQNSRYSGKILGSNQDIHGIFNNLKVLGSNIHFNNVVVLSKIKILGSNGSGTIVVPSLTVEVKKIGSNNDIKIVKKSWQEIALLYDLESPSAL